MSMCPPSWSDHACMGLFGAILTVLSCCAIVCISILVMHSWHKRQNLRNELFQEQVRYKAILSRSKSRLAERGSPSDVAQHQDWSRQRKIAEAGKHMWRESLLDRERPEGYPAVDVEARMDSRENGRKRYSSPLATEPPTFGVDEAEADFTATQDATPPPPDQDWHRSSSGTGGVKAATGASDEYQQLDNYYGKAALDSKWRDTRQPRYTLVSAPTEAPQKCN